MGGKCKGSPAHAGLDPCNEPDGSGACARGSPDHAGMDPIAAKPSARRVEAPPPTRGWTLIRNGVCKRSARLPRPRGDGPLAGG